MNKKRLLAWLMTLVMMIGLMPATALADDGQSAGDTAIVDAGLNPEDLYYTFAGASVDSEADADIILSKTAESKGNGEYEVTLKVNVKEGTIEPKPTEVVFCLDASSSMRLCTNEVDECDYLSNTKTEHGSADNCSVTNNSFEDEDSRWAIAVNAINTMSGNLESAGVTDIKYVYFNGKQEESSGFPGGFPSFFPGFGNSEIEGVAGVVDNYGSLTESLNNNQDEKGPYYTCLSYGVKTALEQFSEDSSTNKVLIIVADGDSNDGYDPDKFNTWKSNPNNAVYGVGFAFSNSDFQNMVGKNNYYTADEADELDVVLEEIQEKVVGMINDPMGPMVKLDTDVEDIVTTSGKPVATLDGSTINWTDADGLEDEVELKYTVSIKNANKEAGEYSVPLNGDAVLNYAYDEKNHSVLFPKPEATVKGATLDVFYEFEGDTINKEKTEWIDLSTEDAFETEIPAVGDTVEIDGEEYTVTAVTGAPEDELEAKAYKVVVTLSQGALISEKFVVTEQPTLEGDATVPADVVYASEDGKVDLPENESVKVLFGISVENGLYEAAEDIEVLDSGATYIGYENNKGSANVLPNGDFNGATVDLGEDEKVTLYFVMEVSAENANEDGVVENIATVNNEEVSAEITIFDKGNVLSIEKVRVDENTENVPDSFAELDDVNYAANPKVDYADGEVTLLYKVTVSNTVATYNLKGLQYTVKDSGATYVGYDKADGVLEPESPKEVLSTDDVTGHLKFGQSIDLYFTKTFEVTDSGDVTNTAKLYIDDEQVDSDTATTEVTVNKGELDSKKYFVVEEPTLTEGEVPSGVVYEAKLPEGETIKLLFAVEVENETESGAGETKTFDVVDADTEYVGYATTATEGVTVTKKTDDSATVKLPAGKTVTLYFVMEVDESKLDANGGVTNTATVDGEEKETTITVTDKGNVLSIEKVRVDSNTANVPEDLKALEHVNYTPATIANPLEVAVGDSVTLLYKVTVENKVPVIAQMLALFTQDAPVNNGKTYVVEDDATYVGCDKHGNDAIADPVADAAAKTVTGTLKETEKIDLYFTKTFTVKDSGNLANIASLPGANTGSATAKTPVKAMVTVTFETQGGSTVEAQTFEKGGTATEPADPTKAGYDFTGWYTTATGDEEFDFTAAVNADTTVYAQWVPEGQLTSDSITKTRIGTAEASTVPELHEINATDITYGDVVFDKDTDTVTLLYKVTVKNNNVVEAKARTLNPGAITYKVVDDGAKYVAYEGKTQPDTEYGTVGEVTGTLEAYETVTLYFAKEFTRAEAVKLSEGTYQVTNTAVLYDGNKEVDSATEPTPVTLKVTVAFDTHGGTTVPPQEIVVGTTATKPAADPTKGGYDFVGWYTDETEGTAFVFTDKIYADTTVHAQWIEKGQLTEDSITKTRVGLTEAQTMPMLNGVNATDITYGDVVFNAKGDKVTLLYAVTVTNNNGAALPKMRTLNPGAVEYKVVDANANYVAFAGAAQPDAEYGANTVTGTLEANETVTLYFAKEFTYKDAVKWSDGTYKVENTADLYWGDTFVGNGTEPTPVTLKEAVSVEKTSSVTTARRNTEVEYTIIVKNEGLTTLEKVKVTETPDEAVFGEGEFVNLPAGVKFVEGSNDEVEIEKLDVDGTVTLTYKAKVKSNAQKNATLVNTVVAEVPNGGPTDSDKLEQGKVYVPSSGGGSSSKKDKEIVAGDVEEILNTEDHFQYVQGYPDGTVGPERNITRAEATVIFFRLLQDHVREELLTAENEFPDVNLDDWFNLGVSTMEAGGFVSGYEDGYFRPNGYITRAELATIISNFDDLEPATENKFADVEGHWAEKYVNSAAAKGWISGYDDGLFRPNQYITRAETMSMINRVLNRRVDEDGLHADAKQWRDNVKGQWYYYAVLEATNHHDYQRADVKDMENWTAINPNKVWEN